MNASDLGKRQIPSVTYTVKLIRGPLETRTWPHTSKASAQSRAHALCKLHSVPEATFDDRSYTFTVDASEFYKKGI